jgi:nicotinamide mononucleotide transporter
MQAFLVSHWLDIVTTILGLAYILLEYRASIWLWAVGFVMQLLGIILYYQKGLYADCGMEFYYLVMTIYGFISWKFFRHNDSTETKQEKPVTHFERRFILPWTGATLLLWGTIYYFLAYHTNSSVPMADSFTTALSLVGIWALARKYLEQWLIWIVVDAVTCVLYFYKDIPFKASLYALYVIIAILGYKKWSRMMKQS